MVGPMAKTFSLDKFRQIHICSPLVFFVFLHMNVLHGGQNIGGRKELMGVWGGGIALWCHGVCTCAGSSYAHSHPRLLCSLIQRIKRFENQATVAFHLVQSSKASLKPLREDAEAQKQTARATQASEETLKRRLEAVVQDFEECRRELLLYQATVSNPVLVGPMAGKPYVPVPASQAGPLAMVHVLVWDSGDGATGVWDGEKVAMQDALRVFNNVLRSLLMVYRGHEVESHGDQMVCSGPWLNAICCCL